LCIVHSFSLSSFSLKLTVLNQFADMTYTTASAFLSFGAIQARASQLLRELNAAEERSLKLSSRVLEDRINHNIVVHEVDVRKPVTIHLDAELVPDPLVDKIALGEQDDTSFNPSPNDVVAVDKKRGSSESCPDPSKDDVVKSPEKRNRLE
jgi:hypothetical protein